MAFTDRLANRGSISTGYDIENSCRFETSETEYMTKDNAATVTAERKTFTISVWVKRSKLGGDPMFVFEFGETDYNTTGRTWLRFDDDQLQMGAGSIYWFKTNRLFRDPSAWYHIVLAIDTTDGTASNRHRLYINGVEETSWHTEGTPDQNLTHGFSLNENHSIGRSHVDNGSYFNGYMAEFHAVGGAQLAPTAFGEFDDDSGIWKPIEYTGTSGTGSTGWGTNGWYLDFADSDNLGDDEKSGGTVLDFTENNIDATNQTTDTPTNNFCTLNVNDRTISTTYDGQLINGGLEYQPESGSSMVRGTMGMSKGKWYWEIKLVTTAGQNFGVCTANMNIPLASSQENGFIINSVDGDAEFFSVYAASHYRSYHVYDGTNWNSAAAWSDTTNFSAGDIFGFAWDGDNLDLYMSKGDTGWAGVLTNQDPEGDPGSNTPFVYHAAINNDEGEPWLPVFSNTYNQDCIVNFGNPIHSISSGNSDANGYGNFEYAVPDGYYALCTKNLAEFG